MDEKQTRETVPYLVLVSGSKLPNCVNPKISHAVRVLVRLEEGATVRKGNNISWRRLPEYYVHGNTISSRAASDNRSHWVLKV